MLCSRCIVTAQSGHDIVAKCWGLNVLRIVKVFFYHMTTVSSRERNKNTKQRKRKEETLMENVNKEKDVKTEIKRKSNNFI